MGLVGFRTCDVQFGGWGQVGGQGRPGQQAGEARRGRLVGEAVTRSFVLGWHVVAGEPLGNRRPTACAPPLASSGHDVGTYDALGYSHGRRAADQVELIDLGAAGPT